MTEVYTIPARAERGFPPVSLPARFAPPHYRLAFALRGESVHSILAASNSLMESELGGDG